MFEILSYKEGQEYHVEFKTPLDSSIRVFSTYRAYKDYVQELIWFLLKREEDFITDLEF
jgi:hypothetical protein